MIKINLAARGLCSTRWRVVEAMACPYKYHKNRDDHGDFDDDDGFDDDDDYHKKIINIVMSFPCM